MDQSPQIIATVLAYGGSDNTAPSFNRGRYVRHGSIHDPAPLRSVPPSGLSLNGMVGAESGSQTLFFRISVLQEARVAVQHVPLNPYTDQYIQVALKSPEGDDLPINQSASGETSFVITAGESSVPVETQIGYLVDDYWDVDYALYEDTSLAIPAQLILAEVSEEEGGLGPLRPPGDYLLVVSSSQWQQLPYQLRIFVRSTQDVEAAATFEIDATGRFTLVDIDGAADFQVDATGRFARFYDLGSDIPLSYAIDTYWESGYAVADGTGMANPQIADFTLSPYATIQRLTPLQGLFF